MEFISRANQKVFQITLAQRSPPFFARSCVVVLRRHFQVNSDDQDDATTSRNPTIVHLEAVNQDLIASNRELTESNQDLTFRNRGLREHNLELTTRNHDLSERNLELSERLHATEDALGRRDEELMRETSMNEELTDRVVSQSTYICKLWIELSTSKGRERRARTVIIVMVFVLLLAFVKK